LIKLLDSADHDVKQAAVVALGEIGARAWASGWRRS
jgi:HEAT repeat protein